MTPEFSRSLRAQDVGIAARRHVLEASDSERVALAKRFGLIDLAALTAELELRREAAGIRVSGAINASGNQACVATAEPVPFLISEPVALLLTEARPEGDEIELAETDLDTEVLEGDSIDVGEIAAQALALALDPYPRSTAPVTGVISEEQARIASSPFAVLRKP